MRGAAAVLGARIRVARPALSLKAPSPRMRRRLLVLAAVCLLLASAYQLWLRDSTFVSVDEVEVTGLTTKDAKRVRAALTSAAHTMTTLHVDRDMLQQAVDHYPVVQAIEVEPDFPHGLRIHVIEHHPAGFVTLGGTKVAVAKDGTLLRGLPVEGRLPAIELEGGVRDDRLVGAGAHGLVRVAAEAPARLRARVERVETRNADGLVVELRDGPELIFGDASRTRAKWAAAARVLADRDAAGASYIDLRLPGRPAAGGLPAETVAPVAPAGAQTAPGVAAAPTAATPSPGTEVMPPDGDGTGVPASGVTPSAPTTGAPAAGVTPSAPAAGVTAPAPPPAPAPSAPQAPVEGAGTAAGGVAAAPG